MIACPLYPGIDCGANDKELFRIQEILLDLMVKHRYIIRRTDKGTYSFVCEYWKDHSDGFHRCPMNENGICRTEHTKEDFPWVHVHKWNGRKMWSCPCG